MYQNTLRDHFGVECYLSMICRFTFYTDGLKKRYNRQKQYEYYWNKLLIFN